MNVEEYEKMYKLEDHYWWFQGRLNMIRAVLEEYLPEPPRPGRVLDVGCGTGLVLKALEGWQPVGLDFSHLALKFCRQRGHQRLARADVVRLPFADNSFDLILALDLIEHIERDDLLIREFNRVLRPGGCVMATVPAHPSLWSDHDIALHHFRRYTKQSFAELFDDGGFDFLKYSYGISFVHPGIVAFRHAQKAWQGMTRRGKATEHPRTHLIMLPELLNSGLVGMLGIEASLLRRMNLPFGTSLVALARKEREAKVLGNTAQTERRELAAV